MVTCFGRPCDHHQANFYRSCAYHVCTIWDPIMCTYIFIPTKITVKIIHSWIKKACFRIYVRYCVLKPITFHIDHYTIHILRGSKFSIGGVTTNRHTLLSLESKQSNIYHCTVCITIMPSSLIIGFCRVVFIQHTLFTRILLVC